MKLGTVVVVLGKLDNRVRENTETLALGTLVEVDRNNMAWVLLGNGEFWRGSMREIAPESEQRADAYASPDEASDESPETD